MGFTKFRRPPSGGRKTSTVGITTRQDGTPLLVVVPAHLLPASLCAAEKVDVLIGDGEDAGAVAIVPGIAHKINRRYGPSMRVACGAALTAACAGARAVHHPRYEVRDGMLVVWPALGNEVPDE